MSRKSRKVVRAPQRMQTRSTPSSVPPWLQSPHPRPASISYPSVANDNGKHETEDSVKLPDNLPVNETAKALAIKEYEATGIDAPLERDLLFKVGTEGYSEPGALNFQENYRRAHEAMMKETLPIEEAANDHIATIAAEQRTDLVEAIQGWRINLHGHAQRFSGGVPMSAELQVREHAYKQICQITKAPAYNANQGLSGFTGKDRRIRARKLPSEKMPEIYAVTGGPGDGRSYAPFDSDKLIDALRKACPDVRAHVEYDHETTECRIKAYFMAPLDLLEFGAGVGRIHHVYMDWRTGDNGTMSLTGQLGIVRAVCRNAGLARTKKSSITLRHSGNYERIASAVATLNASSAEVIQNLREVWHESLMNQYLDSETGEALSPQDAIVRLVAQGMLPLGGLTAEEAEARYIDAWHQEPVYSAGGVIMAVQRAAHAGGAWKTKWYEDDIESAATDLLYQHNYVLDAPTEVDRQIELD